MNSSKRALFIERVHFLRTVNWTSHFANKESGRRSEMGWTWLALYVPTLWSAARSSSYNLCTTFLSTYVWHSGTVQRVGQLHFGAEWSESITEAANPPHHTTSKRVLLLTCQVHKLYSPTYCFPQNISHSEKKKKMSDSTMYHFLKSLHCIRSIINYSSGTRWSKHWQ